MERTLMCAWTHNGKTYNETHRYNHAEMVEIFEPLEIAKMDSGKKVTIRGVSWVNATALALKALS